MVTTPLSENPCNVGTSPSPEACRLSSEDGMFLSQYLEIYMMLPEFLNDFLLTVFKNDAFEWPLYFAEMAPLRKSVVDAFLRWLYWNQDGSTKTSNTIEVVLVILEHKTWRVHWIQIYNKTARRCPGMELMINWLVRITGVFQPLNKNEVDLTWNILMINHWSEQFQRDESQGRMEDLCWKKTPSTWNLHDFSQRRIMFCVNPPHVFFFGLLPNNIHWNHQHHLFPSLVWPNGFVWARNGFRRRLSLQNAPNGWMSDVGKEIRFHQVVGNFQVRNN